jgi:hypothetical protein
MNDLLIIVGIFHYLIIRMIIILRIYRVNVPSTERRVIRKKLNAFACLFVSGQKNKKVKRTKIEIFFFFYKSLYMVETRVASAEKVWREG